MRRCARLTRVLVLLLPIAAAATGQETTAPSDGRTLYGRHCAACHGAQGRGDGPVAHLLFPRPRDLVEDSFRIVSTASRRPTDDDLRRTIAHGMLGSSMPPWGHLPEADLDALVAFTRSLRADGEDPGPPIELPRPTPATWSALERGRAIFRSDCAECHGPHGRGRADPGLVDEDGEPSHPRDIALGIFKGGADPVQLARRITLGMPGTPMPASAYAPADLWALVHYLLVLIDPEAQERNERRHGTIVARRVPVTVDDDPFHPAWPSIVQTWVRLMPLWWRGDRVEGVHVQAMHDGRTLALRLAWRDATEDADLVPLVRPSDAVAVQFSPSTDPPFFGMGEAHDPVRVWEWKAAWQYGGGRAWRTLERALEALLERPAGGGTHMVPEPLFHLNAARQALRAGRGRDEPVEALDAAGPGPRAAHEQLVRGRGVWDGTHWYVVLTRPLDGPGEALDLAPGDAVSVAFAQWDGAADDHGGRKSVSIWHRLVLEESARMQPAPGR